MIWLYIASAFFSGVFVGTCVGVFVVCLTHMAKREIVLRDPGIPGNPVDGT